MFPFRRPQSLKNPKPLSLPFLFNTTQHEVLLLQQQVQLLQTQLILLQKQVSQIQKQNEILIQEQQTGHQGTMVLD